MSKAGRVFFGFSFAAFAWVILRSGQPPMLRDYPDWVFQGVLLAKLLTGHPVAAYALKPYPVPNSLTTVGLSLLTLGFGWMWAGKIWLVLSLGLAAGASLYARRVLGAGDEALWWVLPGTMFLGQTFWFATISFGIGMSLLLLLGCMLYQDRARPGMVAAALILFFFVHLIVYAAAFVMIALYCVQRQAWKPIYAALATTPLVAWYFVGRAVTHSRESDLGHTPVSHLAFTALVALALLVAAVARRQWSTARLMGPVLVSGAGLLVAGAVLSGALLAGPGARLRSPIALLQLKAAHPFDLFGFVNIVYRPVGEVVRSSTLSLVGRPMFLGWMALDVAVGLAIMIGAAGVLLKTRGRAVEDADRAGFLWDFAAFFGLLYLICPPNALGVVSIDMRLAQLALVPVLFLLARAGSKALRLAAAPAALLMLLSLYQFGVSQQRVEIAGTEVRMSRTWAYFCSVDPIILAEEYDRLRDGRLEGHIFATGMFVPAEKDGGV